MCIFTMLPIMTMTSLPKVPTYSSFESQVLIIVRHLVTLGITWCLSEGMCLTGHTVCQFRAGGK